MNGTSPILRTAILEGIREGNWENAKLLWNTKNNITLKPHLMTTSVHHDWLRNTSKNIIEYISAAKNGNMDQMLASLKKDPYVYKGLTMDQRNVGALALAVTNGHLNIVQYLVENDYVAFHDVFVQLCGLAISMNHLPMLIYLYKTKKRDIDAAPRQQYPHLLTLALFFKRPSMVRYLLLVSDPHIAHEAIMDTIKDDVGIKHMAMLYEEKADFKTIFSRKGNTCLMEYLKMHLYEKDAPSVTRWFLGKVDIHHGNNIGQTALGIATDGAAEEIMKILVEEGGASLDDKMDRNRESVFFTSIDFTRNSHDILKWMCEQGDGQRLLTADSNGTTVFTRIVEKNDIPLVKWFLELLADKDIDMSSLRRDDVHSQSALMYHLLEEYIPDTMKWLLKHKHVHGNDIVNDSGETGIFYAVRVSEFTLFQNLVEIAGADVNWISYSGETVWDQFSYDMIPEEAQKFLHVLLPRSEPPEHVKNYLSELIGGNNRLFSEGKKLREQLRPHLRRRKMALNKLSQPRLIVEGRKTPVGPNGEVTVKENVLLPQAIIDHIHSFNPTFTTEEMWNTNLGKTKRERDEET